MTTPTNVLVYDFWKNSSPNEAKQTILFLLSSDKLLDYLEVLVNVEELAEYFCSYCWILKEEAELGLLMNRKEVPTSLLCKLIYSGLGHYLIEGNTNLEFYFTKWAGLIKSEQSLRLLREEPQVDKDVALKIHLLANLDAKSWESFFEVLLSEEKGVKEVLGIFKNIDDESRNRIFFRNPTLYQYLRMILVVDKSDSDTKFFASLESTLDRIYKWEEYAKKMHESFSPKLDKDKVPRDRNAKRISCILHDAVKENEMRDFLEYLTINNAIVDETEFEMIYGLAKNLKSGKGLFF